MVDASSALALRSGGAMPLLGFGTWQIEGEAAHRAVADALAVGYRHLDTATMYGNEIEVGRALHESGLSRDAVFVTTKLPGNASAVRPTIERSLSRLGLDAVDCWLLHWPPARSYGPNENTSVAMFEQMLAVRDAGLTKSVGVSNYSIAELDELIDATGEAPEVNQIPWSPFLHDPGMLAEHLARGVVLEGYSPFQTSKLGNPVLRAIAEQHEVTPAQVVVRWHLQHAIVAIPKSSHRERIAQNFDVFGFVLDEQQMAALDALRRR